MVTSPVSGVQEEFLVACLSPLRAFSGELSGAPAPDNPSFSSEEGVRPLFCRAVRYQAVI